jgi:hypothetical protein
MMNWTYATICHTGRNSGSYWSWYVFVFHSQRDNNSLFNRQELVDTSPLPVILFYFILCSTHILMVMSAWWNFRVVKSKSTVSIFAILAWMLSGVD